MRVETTCPVEIVSMRSVANSTMALRLFNHARERVLAMEGVVKGQSALANAPIAFPYRSERLCGAPRQCFELTVPCVSALKPEHIQFIVTRVRLEGVNADWKSGCGINVEIEPMEPLSDADRLKLASTLSPEARCYAKEYSEAWRCVCGRVSERWEKRCPVCGLTEETAMRCTKDALEQVAREEEHHPIIPIEDAPAPRKPRFALFRRTAAVLHSRNQT